jgi:exopolysaccharide production protein ExoY
MLPTPINAYWRRMCVTVAERVAAAILIAVLSPLLLAIWIAILFLSARSALIAHRRIGQNGSELWVLKFRTMWTCRGGLNLREAFSVEYIDDQIGPFQKSPDDSRVSGLFGRFCRRHSLDELPQLVNVLSGEMSLVGPRPVTPAEIIPIYGLEADEVLSVKPGLSGLWQISGRNRLSVEERCRLDLECVRKRSVGMYFRVLMRTLPELFSGESAW